MNELKEKENNLWLRIQFLELVKYCIRFYELTGDKKFYERAKYFGKVAKSYENGVFKG